MSKIKIPEEHFINHSEVLEITGSYRYQLQERMKKEPDNEILKYLSQMFEDISEDLTQALFQKGKFAPK